MIIFSIPFSDQTKYRLSYRFMVIHTLIALISPRMIGLIDARRNNNNNQHYFGNDSFIQSKMIMKNPSSLDIMKRGHSHNDYHQENPLQSALMHGLRSVEVDVFPIEGELFVAHTRLELDEKRTIDNMYIDPILDVLKSKSKAKRHRMTQPFPPTSSKRSYSKTILSPYQQKYQQQQIMKTPKRTKQNFIDPSDDSLILLVDFKSEPNICAKLLTRAIEPLKPFLSKVKDGKFYKGEVTVIVSGSKPKEENLFEATSLTDDNSVVSFGMNSIKNMRRPFGFANNVSQKTNNRETAISCTSNKKSERFLFIDGRVNDLYQEKSTSLYPMISLNWSTVQFHRLLGRGDDYMKKCADLAHLQGKRLRIWGAPNIESVWRRMMRSNVDWLSIDNHERFARFAMKSG